MGQRIPYQGQPLSGATVSNNRIFASGDYHILPAGVIAVQLGRQMAIEVFNTNNGTWWTYAAGPSATPISVTSDGVNFRLINLSGTISGATITNAGSSYVQATTSVSFSAPASGVTATGVAIVGGDLTLTVTAGGANYSKQSYLVIDSPWINGANPVGSLPAFAIPTITAGALASITFTGGFAGAGYVGVPSVTLIDPTGAGSGAVVTAAIGTANAAKITGILMTNNGAGYDGTHIPTVTITGAGSSAAATAVCNFALQSVTVTSGGTGFGTTGPILMTDGGMIALNLNGEELVFKPAYASTTVSGGVIQSAPAIEDNGAGFQSVPSVVALNNGAVSTAAPALVAVVGGVNSFSRTWVYE